MADGGSKSAGSDGNAGTHAYSEAFRSWFCYHQWIQHSSILSYHYITSTAYMCAFLKGHTPNFMTSARTVQSYENQETVNQTRRGKECEIPSLWRRLLAEIIDFSVLLLLKVGASLVIMDYIDFIDVDAYDLENFYNLSWNPKITANFTMELIMIEITNRLCVAIFEALCLRGGTMGNIGGATPGKRLLGLRVVSCNEIVRIDGNKVAVHPANNMTFLSCLSRSLIKNFSYLFFFPMPFTSLIFPFKRAAYDIFSGCIVVYIGEEYSNNFR